jgi:hypothetical protein
MKKSDLSEEVLIWAFGPLDGSLISSLPDKWNGLHPDLFHIDGHDSIENTERKIQIEFDKVLA